MFNKLSMKIGLLFFIFILIIESVLFFILYINLANNRIEEVMDDLLARSNTHREVLEDQFESQTLEHVGLMESASDFVVVIADASGNILIHSDPIEQEMEIVIANTDVDSVSPDGEIVESRWTEKQYIVASSPVMIEGKHHGHVFMFAPTSYVQKIVDQLGDQFLVAGIITIAATIITIFILSRFITIPIIRLKEATEQLSDGKKPVELHTHRRDELGELTHSITTLSKDLSRLKRERTEFLASISHELRTPLTYMKGYADIASRADVTEEERTEYLTIIREETEHLNGLIKQLFDLAKMDQNKFTIDRENMVLTQFLASLAERIKLAFEAENVTFVYSCPDDTIIYADPGRFQQVLLNILDNARKYASAGTQVTLAVIETEEDVQLVITDQGEGIPKEDLPQLFDRFYRVEKSRSRERGGSGLGLAIANEIIEAHGGTIDIQSKRGEGTSVIISLKKRGDSNV
ncbi:sensor histidine kinase [Oceanobacillus halotolerans]|uniref:sensor histidine kinase n=1 Tax=Oceanobacillus halotolerans TaxID=2663380 RepID=UPI0013D93FFD|nr:ATP-binding protein [Oceanobacillus halotolerans]